MRLYESLESRLRNQHEAIINIVEGLDDVRMKAHAETGKWSIHDNIAHLAKYQPIFVERISAILNLNEPVFGAYRAEYDLDFETWRSWDTSELLDKLATDRKEIFDLIMGLAPEELERVGIHNKWGRLNIIDWTEFFVLHEAHHIRTIFKLAHGPEDTLDVSTK